MSAMARDGRLVVGPTALAGLAALVYEQRSSSATPSPSPSTLPTPSPSPSPSSTPSPSPSPSPLAPVASLDASVSLSSLTATWQPGAGATPQSYQISVQVVPSGGSGPTVYTSAVPTITIPVQLAGVIEFWVTVEPVAADGSVGPEVTVIAYPPGTGPSPSPVPERTICAWVCNAQGMVDWYSTPDSSGNCGAAAIPHQLSSPVTPASLGVTC